MGPLLIRKLRTTLGEDVILLHEARLLCTTRTGLRDVKISSPLVVREM